MCPISVFLLCVFFKSLLVITNNYNNNGKWKNYTTTDSNQNKSLLSCYDGQKHF